MPFVIGWLDMSGLEAKISELTQLMKGEFTRMSEAMDRLIAASEANETVTASIVTALGEVAAKVRELANEPAKLNELADELEGRSARIAEAVLANTDVIDSDNPPEVPPAEEPPAEEPPAEEPTA